MSTTETALKPITYCESLTSYIRRKSRVVTIGDVPLGGNYPIRIQSMTTTDTMDTVATVEQSIRMIEAGSEYVRITAPSLKEAENLRNIKTELRKRGYNTPLIADIHFTPNAAELAATIVEKVRVNPGNYADKKKFDTLEYTDEAYNSELDRIRKRFAPLVKICKEHGTAMRIGANHGSLSDRIMSRYGDTPLGMVESALEFVRICEENNFKEIVLSMKASNPLVMVQAYRLLVIRMNEEGMNYPLHLGVTEAGEGEDGRIKSAVGIGTLLEDGLGDTIRVSLTEEPEAELPVAKFLVERYNNKEENRTEIPPIDKIPYSPIEYKKRETNEVLTIGGKHHPVVIADWSQNAQVTRDSLAAIGYRYNPISEKWKNNDQAADYLYLGDRTIDFASPENLKIIHNYPKWRTLNQTNSFPYFDNYQTYHYSDKKSDLLNFVAIFIDNVTEKDVDFSKNENTIVWVVQDRWGLGMIEERRIFLELMRASNRAPVIIKRDWVDATKEENLIDASIDVGGLLIDGMGEGVMLSSFCPVTGGKWEDEYRELNPAFLNGIAFGILQATRTRISKTEYISCPSCGRTLFNLQEVTAKIHERTAHLKGVKIGIMGCVVNGPGEMADADYGYVGTGVGKITLFKGKEVVQRNIPSGQAVEALIALIKNNGDWVEEPVESNSY